MKKRVSLTSIIECFENCDLDYSLIPPLSGEEYEVWIKDEKVCSLIEVYTARKRTETCYIYLHNIRKYIYEIIALMCIYEKIYYLQGNQYKLFSTLEERITIFTDSETMTEKEYFMIKGIEESSIPVTPPTIPKVSENLDDYQPIDRSLVDYGKYMNHIGQAMVTNCISIQFSRGCHFNCAYCQKVYLNPYRNRTAENMFSEIDMYYKMGVKRFAFVDDLPNFNRSESIKLLKMIYRNKMDIQLFFPNGLRGDILDHEYIDYMIQAGTVNIDLALETASSRLQKLIKKNLDIEKLKDNIDYIISQYPFVILELQMMIGLPTETGEEARMSMNFIEQFKWIDFPYMHILKIYPNTPMAELALKCGISYEDIESSNDLGYHELPNTLPFSKFFVKKCQSQFLNQYILRKDRLQNVLLKQSRVMTEEELVQKYDSYLPISINTIDDIKKLAGMDKLNCVSKEEIMVERINTKMQSFATTYLEKSPQLRILLLDLTLFFEEASDKIYHVVEPPLGHLYLLSYLNKKLGTLVKGKIIKSGVDFQNYMELKRIIGEFSPDLIGIRGMNYYKNFLHYTVNLIRQWGFKGYITIGGPYATSSYNTLLCDTNIDFAMIGEGEETLLDLVTRILQHKDDEIKDIDGIVKRVQNNIMNINIDVIDL